VEETNKRIFTFPTSQIKLSEKRSSCYEVIYSLEFEECNSALKEICNRVELDKICEFVDETPLISDIQKTFYRHMICERYKKILIESFELLRS
jgi:hypothetical protein